MPNLLASAALRDVATLDGATTRLVCPLCTYEQQRLLSWVPAADGALALQIEGGCGCRWTLQLEAQDGGTRLRVQIAQPCLRPSGLQPLADAAEAVRLLDEYEL